MSLSDPRTRWLKYVTIGDPDECWEWQGQIASSGYGTLGVKGPNGWRPQGAHRLAWEFFVGEIPPGMHVLHHCDNPPCVNYLRHLWLGTNQDNMDDMDSKGRRRARTGLWGNALTKSLQTHCKYGHEFTEANTYWRPDGRGRHCRACAAIAEAKRVR